MSLTAPFPWFGGKRKVANIVWDALGRDPAAGGVRHYVEPFAGSLAALLHAPAGRVETVNDADGLLANFWRAVKAHPDAVAEAADWPVNEADLHARHLWLVGQRETLTERLMADPDWCDPRAAGWWVWGCSAWIGSGWCSGDGPWRAVDGVFTAGGEGPGVNRQLPYIGNAGIGIHSASVGGVRRKLPYISSAGRGIHSRRDAIGSTMRALSARLAAVRVACGDWSRVCGPSVLAAASGPVGVFLDPPYAMGEGVIGRDEIYSVEDGAVSASVRAWALDAGRNPNARIVLAGYDDEHEMPGWRVIEWKTAGGYGRLGGSNSTGRGAANAHRERLWFSPGCLDPTRQGLLL